MTPITTEALQAYADRRLATLRTRAASYLVQALEHPGEERALTLARMIDSVGDEVAGLNYLVDACNEIAHDPATGDAIARAWRDTAALLNEHAYAARIASIPGMYHAATAVVA